MFRRTALLSLAAAAALSLTACSSQQPAARWWAHVEYLASDALEGRATGTPGHRKAVEYAAEEFRRAGLQPAGTDGYFQNIAFTTRAIDEAGSSLTLLERGAREVPLTLGQDANFNLRVDPAQGLTEAPLVFVGYGLVVPEVGHDDFAGLDLRGKILVVLSGAPAGMSGNLSSHYQSWSQRSQAMREAGAIGLVTIANPNRMDIPWERSTLQRFEESMSLDDPAMNETEGLRLAVTVNPAQAERWFVGSGHAFADLVLQAERRVPLPRFSLPRSLRAQVVVQRGRLTSDNVVALLPGSDEKLKDEYVVLTAHIDHLGVRQTPAGPEVYNGAMDNAAGTATMLEVARELAAARRPSRRSLLFVLVTAEEKGLLGSRHFASYPTVPREKIVANLNVDMFRPIIPLKILRVYGLEESTLGELARATAAQHRLAVQGDPEPLRNSFVRSDQYSFVRAGIPALALTTGFELDTPQHTIMKNWLTRRYHAPSDDLEQPVDREAAELFNRVTLDLARRIADSAERPRWNEESFFRRYAPQGGADPAR
jgi:hypothetical protein